MNKEVSILKENFIIKFCRKMGWDINNLTTNQMRIIVNNYDYKNIK